MENGEMYEALKHHGVMHHPLFVFCWAIILCKIARWWKWDPAPNNPGFLRVYFLCLVATHPLIDWISGQTHFHLNPDYPFLYTGHGFRERVQSFFSLEGLRELLIFEASISVACLIGVIVFFQPIWIYLESCLCGKTKRS